MESDIREHREPRRSTRVRLAATAALCTLLALAVGLGVVATPGPAHATVGGVPQQTPGASTTTTAPAPGGVPTITSNSVIVVEQGAGQVSVIEGGRPRVIAGGLSKPNGAAVLSDGGIVVADSGNNRLVGIGGSFGATLQEIVQVPFPVGVGVGADGAVYVTLLLAGEVGRVDLQAKTYTKVAGDLKGPGDVAERAGTLYVTEGSGGDVLAITPAGERTVVATGFQQPIGVVAGPDETLFVADFQANAIVRVDAAGAKTNFATLDAPVQLASAPFVLTPDLAAFALVVTADEGLIVLDNAARRVSTIPVDQATGVATGDVTGAAPPSTTTTTATATTSTTGSPGTSAVSPGTTPGTAATGTPRTTRVRPTTTLAPLDGTPASSTGNILLFSLAVIVLTVIALLTVYFVRRPKTMQKSGFEERPLDADSVADAFGPCAAEEVEVAEAEGARDAVIVQREATEKRLAGAVERVAKTRVRLEEAVARRTAVEAERAEAQEHGPPSREELGSTEIKPDELGLTTDGGREALAAFATGDLDAHELEERWRELGEQQAIEVVREVGERRARLDPTKPWPDELRAIADEEKARADLAESERDVEFAEAEIQRLNERETEVLDRIDAAHTALEDCQSRHRDAQRAKASSARAEARAAQAAADAAAARSAGAGDGPASEPVPSATAAAPSGPGSPDDPEGARRPDDGPDGDGPADDGPRDDGPRDDGPRDDGPGGPGPGGAGPGGGAPEDGRPGDGAGATPAPAAPPTTDPGAEGSTSMPTPTPAEAPGPADAPAPPPPRAAAPDATSASDPSDRPGPTAPSVPSVPSEVVPDRPRVWGGRKGQDDPAPDDGAAPAATAPAAPETDAAATAVAPDPSPGTREEMLALVEAAKRSKREASPRGAAGTSEPEGGVTDGS